MTSSTARTAVRKLGRNWLGVALSLLIVAGVGAALWHLLRDIDVGKVIAAFTAQPIRNIVVAGVFVVLGYVTLTFYDVFALHIIGRRTIPFHVAALASFTSYTIGHSLGAATLTGAVVRLRVYSAWGLNVLDIAKIAFVTGMTFWLGNAVVLGGAITYAPEAASVVDHLPPWINRIVGLVGACSASPAIWPGSHRGRAPSATPTGNWYCPRCASLLVQTGIGAMDLCLVTAAMYVLLPQNPAVDFVPVLVIFVTATLLGTVSHVPGSLGVIEAALLIGLPQFPKEELLAALLTFRVAYFVIPFLLATLALGLRELGLVARPTMASPPS